MNSAPSQVIQIELQALVKTERIIVCQTVLLVQLTWLAKLRPIPARPGPVSTGCELGPRFGRDSYDNTAQQCLSHGNVNENGGRLDGQAVPRSLNTWPFNWPLIETIGIKRLAMCDTAWRLHSQLV